MAFDYTKPNSPRFGALGDHKASILKKVLADGKIKIYRDHTGAAERTEITLPEGRVVVIKDYEQIVRLAKFKKIEVYSASSELLDALDIVTNNSLIHTYTIYYKNNPLGRGSGDINLCLAEGMLEGSIDPRLLTGSSIDPEVMETVKKILQGKRL